MWWFYVALVILSIGLIRYYGRKVFTVHLSGGIIVTGCSSGIGKSTAIKLASIGFTVFATVRKEADAEQLRQIGNDHLIPIIVDIANSDAIRAAHFLIMSQLRQRKQQLVGLVNNAGFGVSTPCELATMDSFREVFDTNFFGTFELTKAFLPQLRESKGRIVNVSTIAVFLCTVVSAQYVSSKCALEGFNNVLRKEMAPFGVAVITVEPSVIATNFFQRYTDGLRQSRESDAQGLYTKMVDRVENSLKFSQRIAGKPETVTKSIVHALTAQRPRMIYRAGLDAMFAYAVSWFLQPWPSAADWLQTLV